MPARQVLSPNELKDALVGLVGWDDLGGKIGKTFPSKSYATGVLFTVAVGHVAESMDHHPDITLTYPSVRIETSTHDAGGVTMTDIELARRIEALA
ncbi:MAG: 4a-hydroxytetrahydrobiopterin dehydratase [Armatimonadetes bacterium]|nr:4a-hydroxytetrahydrobiopterin dehydratase [Armatimonadota bacterium]